VKSYVIGVDLGGTKIATAVMDREGKIKGKNIELTQILGGPEVVIGQMIRMTRLTLSKAKVGLSQIKGIGIGAAGPLNIKTGIIITPPNLPGWHNVQLIRPFQKEFKTPVFLDNDANAAALGEWKFGAGRGCKNMVYLTISTGIGGGIIIGGKLYRGTNYNAGEIGHMTIDPEGPLCGCGNRGCLEAHSSGTAIARWAREALSKDRRRRTGIVNSQQSIVNSPQRTKKTMDYGLWTKKKRQKIKGSGSLILELAKGDLKKVSAELVFQAAKKGDRKALEVVRKSAEFLGIGVANVINVFNPQRVVLGGGVTKAGSLLFKPVREVAYKRAMPALAKVVEIVPAKLGDDVGIIGAATLVLTEDRR